MIIHAHQCMQASVPSGVRNLTSLCYSSHWHWHRGTCVFSFLAPVLLLVELKQEKALPPGRCLEAWLQPDFGQCTRLVVSTLELYNRTIKYSRTPFTTIMHHCTWLSPTFICFLCDNWWKVGGTRAMNATSFSQSGLHFIWDKENSMFTCTSSIFTSWAQYYSKLTGEWYL